MTQFCPNCGQPYGAGAAFCVKCGFSLRAAGSQISPEPVRLSGGHVPMLSEPGAVPAVQTYFDGDPPGARYIGQWNWGAAFLTPWWLMNHRSPVLGAILLLIGFVPFVNVLTLVTFFYYGINGNKVAVRSGRFRSEETFVAVQNAWRNWGIALFSIGILATALTLVLGAHSSHQL